MKKQLAMALAASVVLSAAGTVFAAENPYDFKFSGSLNTQFRNDDKTNYVSSSDVNASGLKTTITLNMEKQIAQNLSLYSRFTHQSFNNTTARDNQKDWISGHEEYNTAIDAYGLKYSNGGVNYVLGTQTLAIGATGLVYDNAYIGKHALPYALKVNAKAGATDLTGFYAKTNYQDDYDNDKIYGLQGQYAINDKSSVGAFYAHAAYGADTKALVNGESSLNYYGVNTAYKFTNKLGFVAEYIKSDADRDNKGYIGGFTYAVDNKSSVGVSAYRVEDQAAIADANFGNMTTAPNGNAKGYIFSYNYKLNDNTSFAASYDTQDKLKDSVNAGTSNDRNRTKVGVTFSF